MKHLPYILSLIILALCLFCVSLVLEMRDKDRLQQSEINHLRKKNQVERDSLENVLKLTSDSLDIAFATIRLAKEETQKAKEKSQREIGKLREIIFIAHSDSSRTAELKTLYPSWKQK